MSFNPINSTESIANVVATTDADPASAFRVQSDARFPAKVDAVLADPAAAASIRLDGAYGHVQLTQAAYDALTPPVAGTLYVVVG